MAWSKRLALVFVVLAGHTWPGCTSFLPMSGQGMRMLPRVPTSAAKSIQVRACHHHVPAPTRPTPVAAATLLPPPNTAAATAAASTALFWPRTLFNLGRPASQSVAVGRLSRGQGWNSPEVK